MFEVDKPLGQQENIRDRPDYELDNMVHLSGVQTSDKVDQEDNPVVIK